MTNNKSRKRRRGMTKTYELPNDKMLIADVDEKHHTATVSVYALDELVEAVNKTGHWIETPKEDITECMAGSGYVFMCSECKNWENHPKSFCPNCGAEMVKSQEGANE